MLEPQDIQEIKRLVDLQSRRSYDKRVGDTPNDSLQLAPKKYINIYGSIAGRPASVAASIGQQFFSTDLGKPIFFNTNNNWVDATGSVVASN